LLPSTDIRAVAKDAILVVLRRDDPACAALRTEFAVPFLSSWVVVLDSRGETLASSFGDVAGGGCDQDRVKAFPGNLARLIRRTLTRRQTVEELERWWRAHPNNRTAFEKLRDRLSDMLLYGQLRRLCSEAATNRSLPKRRRNEYRLLEFVARASDSGEGWRTPESRAKFVRDGERLLIELAGHPRSADLVDALFASGYAHAFDVPARTARAIARLRRAASRAADPGALEERIRQLLEVRDRWVETTTAWLRKTEMPSAKDHIAALLGDAEAAIRLFSELPYREMPGYRDWLRQAQEKAERQRQQVRR
jgi:hypothetical protein